MEIITWPVFTLSQREAVNSEDGIVYVADPFFMLKSNVFAPDRTMTCTWGFLFFSSKDNAERCLARINKPDHVVATFRNSTHLKECLRYDPANLDHVIFDRFAAGATTYHVSNFFALVERNGE